MAGENVVNVKFGADASGIRRGASEASQHLEGLTGKLRDLKAEQVAQARTVKFYATELAGLVGVADSSKAALQGLLGVLLSGSAIGGAVEGIVFLVHTFHQLEDAEQKSAAAAQKFADDAAKAVADLKKQVDGMVDAWNHVTAAAKLSKDQLDPALEEERKAVQAITRAQQNLANARASATKTYGTDEKAIAITGLQIAQLIHKESDAYLAALTAWQTAADKVRGIREQIGRAATGEQKSLVEKELEKDAAAWGVYADDVFAQTEKMLLEQAQAADENEKLVQKQLADTAAAWGKYADEIFANDEQLLRDIEAAHDATTKKTAKNWKEVAKSISSDMAQTVSGIITGTQSIGDAFANLAQRLLTLALDQIFKGIFGALGGPLGGLLGSLLPFETGGDIPTAASGLDLPKIGGAMPILAHAGEAVVTRSTTDRLGTFLDRVDRGELLGGAGGGGEGPLHLHFHGVVNDAAGIEKLFRSHDARRTVAQMRRLGEWP